MNNTKKKGVKISTAENKEKTHLTIFLGDMEERNAHIFMQPTNFRVDKNKMQAEASPIFKKFFSLFFFFRTESQQHFNLSWYENFQLHTLFTPMFIYTYIIFFEISADIFSRFFQIR